MAPAGSLAPPTAGGILRAIEPGGPGAEPRMKLTVRPLTPDLWPAFEDLFANEGVPGPCNRCWCMYWRIGGAYRRRPPGANRAAFRAIVRRGPPPGLVALDGGTAVGWCQLTPRDALPWLLRERRRWRVDDRPVRVWSLTCFYVRKSRRRQGVTAALIRAALAAAKQAKAPALEAYPVDREVSPSASGTGIASTFARAGFETVARPRPARPIVRHDLKRVG